MGKRSDFKRVARDFYPTPNAALLPLVPFLDDLDYVEPCAGDGALISHLKRHNKFVISASDIEPQGPNIDKLDVLDIKKCDGDMFVTNPPWEWSILKDIIPHLSTLAPTWLLLNADLMHNIRMGPYMKKCAKVVSVGRVKWFGSQAGMENASWYQFIDQPTQTIFYGRGWND